MPGTGLTEGERWAREELARLRERQFAPAAIGRFLAASGRRAADRRAARPRVARRARAWSAAGAGAWATLAVAGVEPFRERARSGLAWQAATALMLDWHLGMVETEDGRSRQLSAADALTLGRSWLVPVAARSPTPLVCGVAALSDVADGWVARSGAWGAEPTRLGRDLEGLVDAAFTGAALRGARRRGWIGRPAIVAEGVRLAAGLGYSLWRYLGVVRAPDRALTRAARVTTPVRAAGLVAAGLGRRRTADALVAGAALGGVGLTLRAVGVGRGARVGAKARGEGRRGHPATHLGRPAVPPRGPASEDPAR